MFDRVRLVASSGCVLGAVAVNAAPLATTNGDFETTGTPAAPFTGDGDQDIQSWFDSDTPFTSWHFGANGDHAVALNGWLYQSLGTFDSAEGTTLNWSFDNEFENGGTQDIEFFAGAFAGAVDGDDIGDEGLASLGSVSGLDGAPTHTGSVDLSALTNGTEVWVRISGDGFEQIDNVSVTQVPEPSSLALLALGAAAMLRRRRAK